MHCQRMSSGASQSSPTEIAGVLLAQGQYCSMKSYSSAIKRAHVSAQRAWTDLHIQIASGAIRAGSRGKGPGRQLAWLLWET